MTTNPTTKENTMTTKTLTDPDGVKLAIEAYPGGLEIATGRSLTAAAVRNIDPDELIAAIREVAGMDDTPKPDPAHEYTAEDFAKAAFARHEDGRIAARLDDDSLPWRASDGHWRSDADMAAKSWRIVTPAPTTARDLLAMLPDLCYEPEENVIPADAGYVVTRDGVVTCVAFFGPIPPILAGVGDFRCLLLDPPATVTPEWHSARIVEARVLGSDPTRCQWASSRHGRWVALNGLNFSIHRDNLTDVKVIVPGEVEA